MSITHYQAKAPDTLIANIRINLTEEQKAYLNLNKDVARTILCQVFNKSFKTHYSKLQLTAFIAEMKEQNERDKITKPKRRRRK